MRSIRVATLVACAFVVVPLLAQSPMREGRWETTGQMEMPGVPVKMPEMKTSRCITQAELKDPASTLPNASPDPNDKSCKASDYKTEGNKITWKMACTGANSMTGTGEMVFKGDTYTGTVNMTMAQGAMAMKLAGKRIGDCTP